MLALAPPVATYSIVARDPVTGEFGIGVQSRFLAVGAVVPWAAAGAGAIATQSWANTTFGPRGLDLLRSGLPAQEVLDRLMADDDGRDHRQVGIVDAAGRAAAWTGRQCLPWTGHRSGTGYTCQGNILAGAEVLDGMAGAYERSTGHLADRLATALGAAEAAGGDSRGKQSAALLVVREGGGYGGFNDRLVDLRVDDHPEPVAELDRLLELHRQTFLSPTPPEKWWLDSPDKVRNLQLMLRDTGIFDGAVSGELTYNTRGALAAFCRDRNLPDADPSGTWAPGETILALRREVMARRQVKR